MSFESLILTSTLLLSSGAAQVTRSYAKNDKEADATLV